MRTGLSLVALCFVCTGLFLLNKAASGQETPGLSCKDCTDIPPGGTYTCFEQKFFGKCSAQWMRDGGYCLETCGYCVKCRAEGVSGSDSPSSSSTPPHSPNSRTAHDMGCSCTDVQPPGPYTCNEQVCKPLVEGCSEGGSCLVFCGKCGSVDVGVHQNEYFDCGACRGSERFCAYQLRLGKCKADWMINTPQLNEGFCQITCGRCECMNPDEKNLLVPNLPIAEDCLCTDVIPPGKDISCREQRSYGKCEADWMLDTTIQSEGYCQTTCGRCFCSIIDASTDPPAAVVTPPSFVPPMLTPSPEAVELPAPIAPDPLGRSSYPILSVSPPRLQMPVMEVVTTSNPFSTGENKANGSHAIIMRNPDHPPLVVVIKNPLDAPEDVQGESSAPRPLTRSTVLSRVPIIVVPIEGVPSESPQVSGDEVAPTPEMVLEPLPEVTYPAFEPSIENGVDSELTGGEIDLVPFSEYLQPLDDSGADMMAGPLDEPFLELVEPEDAKFGHLTDAGLIHPSVEPEDEPGLKLGILEEIAIGVDMQPNIEPLDDSDTDFLFLPGEDITPVHEPGTDVSTEGTVVAREANDTIFSEPSLEPLSDPGMDNQLYEEFEPLEEPSSEPLVINKDTIEDEMEFLVEPSIEPAMDDSFDQLGIELAIRPPRAESAVPVDEMPDAEAELSIEPSLETLRDRDRDPIDPDLDEDLDILGAHEPSLESVSHVELDLGVSGFIGDGPLMEPLMEPHAEPLIMDIEETSTALSDRERNYGLEPITEAEANKKPESQKLLIEPSSEIGTLDEDDLDEFEDPAAEAFFTSSAIQGVNKTIELESAETDPLFEEAMPGPAEEPAVGVVEPLDEESVSVPADRSPQFEQPEETGMALGQKLPSRDNCTDTSTLLSSKASISVFSRMVEAAGLMDSEGNLEFQGTLLAPNNAAVERYLAANELDLDELLGQEILLKALISFFIIDEVLYLEDLYNGKWVKPRVTGAEPLVILRTDLTLRGRMESIIVIVGTRDTARVVDSGLVSCDVAVHIIDRFLPPSVMAPALPVPETIPLDELESKKGSDIEISPEPEEELMLTDTTKQTVNTSSPSPQVDTGLGLSASLLEGILDFEDDPANKQTDIAEKMLSGEIGITQPNESNRGE